MAVRREDADRYLLAKIFERKTPVLGIGPGMQQLNVFAGGTLHLRRASDGQTLMRGRWELVCIEISTGRPR